MKYATIFDMDGVLVDSSHISQKSFNEVLKNYGIELGEDEKQSLGKSLRDKIAGWNQKYGLSLELELFSNECWQIQLQMLEGIKPDQGLVKLLEDLRYHKVPMGVGTSSQGFRAEKILDILGIRDYFQTLVVSNDVQNHKPYPDLFLEVAKRLKINPENCIVIEDADNGLEAAKRGRMKTIGYLANHNATQEFSKADLVVRSFSELSYCILARQFL